MASRSRSLAVPRRRVDPLRAGLPLLAAAARFAAITLPGLRTANFLAAAWWSQFRTAPPTEIPALRPSLSLAAKVAIDESIIAMMVALGVIPSWRDIKRIERELAAARELYEERGWVSRPTSYHAAPPAPEGPSLRTTKFRRLVYEHLSFESGYEPDCDEPGRARWLDYRNNRTAHAWILRHRSEPRPWLICMHGYRMGLPGMDIAAFRAAWLHFKLGLNVALPVFPLHGPRANGWSGAQFLAGDALDTIHALAQAMWDARRLLAWIRNQDGRSIGVYGISLGGYSAALLSTLDQDLSYVIAGVPPSDFLALARNHSHPLIAWVAGRATGANDDIDRVFRVVSPLASPPRVPPERRYVFGGLGDRLVPTEQVEALWRHWGRPRCAWYNGSHLSFQREPEVRALLREAFGTAGLQKLPSAVRNAKREPTALPVANEGTRRPPSRLRGAA